MTPRMDRLTSTRMSRKLLQALQSVSASSAYNVRDNEVARGAGEDDILSNESQMNGDEVSDKNTSKTNQDESSNVSETINNNSTNQQTSTFPSSLMALAKFVRNNSLTGSATSSPVPPSQPETLKCSVHFLDDTQHVFELDRSAKGEELLELVFRHLELIEREYFALQFSETVFHHHPPYSETRNGSLVPSSFGTTVTRYNRWLDPGKKIRKQMRFTKSPFTLNFRVKFYVTEINRLFEEYTRYHFYLQIRKDILDGRLSGPESTMALLGSYVLQSELGDYSPEEHSDEYSSNFCFIPNQNREFEKKVISLHRMHSGQTPADAELNYLEEAKKLEFYGVDLHQARDADSNDIQIGVSGSGLTVFRNHIKLNTFSWAKIVKISFKRRFFFIQLKHEGTEQFDNVVGFNLCSYRACKSLWKSCVEQHTFFRLHTPKPLTKKFFFFFSLGSKFRYSGKTEFQTIEENKRRLTRTERIFIRNSSKMLTNNTSRNDIAAQHLANLRMTSTSSVTANTGTGKQSVKFQITNGHSKSRSSSSASSTEDVESSASLPLNGSSVPIGVASRNKYCINKSSAISLIINKISSTQNDIKKTNTLQQSNTMNTKSVSQSISYDNLHKNKIKDFIKFNSKNKSSNKSDKLVISDNISMESHHYDINGIITKSTGCDGDNLQTNNRYDAVTDGGAVVASKAAAAAAAIMPAAAAASSSSSSASGSKTDEVVNNGKIVNCAMSYVVDIEHHSHNADTVHQTDSNIYEFNEHINIENKITSGEGTLPYSMDSPILDLINELYEKGITESSNKVSSITTTTEATKTSSATTIAIKNKTITSTSTTTEATSNIDGNFSSTDVETNTKLVENESILSSANSSNNSSPVHLVTIRIKPDSEGRFGFNFKGGADQNCDILISRVAPNTPADNAKPIRLNEGDQVLIINGQDVKGLKHDEVVDLIRSTNDSGDDPELCLIIRPLGIQVPLDDDNPPNPGFIYSIQSGNSLESQLEVSMNLLAEGLESETILAEFEQLSRRDEKETITLARAMENISKNRYLDIAPYDSTRVILEECISGDYINASYVTMKVETTNTINRYIATQGPLKRTTSDFWQMIWEQKCSVIVMVTPLVEDGRKKCYKYWPEINETTIVNERLQLTQQSCRNEIAFLERTFHLHDPESGEEHQVKHLQYLAWPDQGIPDDDSDFLKLISRVRELRKDSPDSHVVVHCSAGIGRTGVLILMETGICKIEANEPLYPLDMVRMMRTQRAMLIQTTMQFYFVCQALYHVWRDKVVKPLNITNNNDSKPQQSSSLSSSNPPKNNKIDDNDDIITINDHNIQLPDVSTLSETNVHNDEIIQVLSDKQQTE